MRNRIRTRKATISPKQLAKSLGVSESSIKRWCDSGAIQSEKTAGGHRRISVADVLKYCRETGFDLDGESLSLPVAYNPGKFGMQSAVKSLFEVLLSGEENAATQILLDLQQSGVPGTVLADQVISPVFVEIGKMWACGGIGIGEERLASTTIINAIHQFATQYQLAPKPNAAQHINEPRLHPHSRFALGAGLAGDHYQISSALVSLILNERNWQSRFAGNDIPMGSFLELARTQKPNLIWMSINHQTVSSTLLKDLNNLVDFCAQEKVRLALGGRALDSEVDKLVKLRPFYFRSMTEFGRWVDIL